MHLAERTYRENVLFVDSGNVSRTIVRQRSGSIVRQTPELPTALQVQTPQDILLIGDAVQKKNLPGVNRRTSEALGHLDRPKHGRTLGRPLARHIGLGRYPRCFWPAKPWPICSVRHDL